MMDFCKGPNMFDTFACNFRIEIWDGFTMTPVFEAIICYII